MKSLMLAASLLVLAGCAGSPAGPGRVGDCANCGTVRGVDLMHQSGEATGAGALMGAVIGGVIGHQFGSGRGQDAATAAGAVGGAAMGHQAEKQANTGSFYRITVDMDRGNTESINVANSAGLRPGSRVRVIGRNIEIVER